MTIKNNKIVSKPIIKFKWLILLLIILLVIIWLLPQRTLKIRIITTSDTEQLFYIETRAGTVWRGHGLPSTKLLDKRLISANKVHRIRVSGNLRPWFGGSSIYGDKMYVRVKHPEYRNLMIVEEGYRGKLLTATPQSWPSLLEKEPLIEFDYPEPVYQEYDYKEQLAMGKILRASEITRHISWVADYYSEPKHDFLPVLHQLADYVNTHSIGRYDIGKRLQDEIVAMKNDFITIEERLDSPVGWRLPILGEVGKKRLRGDFNGDGKLDKVHTLFGTGSSNKKEIGLFVYYGGESKNSKPVKINKERIEAKEYRLYGIEQGKSIVFNRNKIVDFKYGGFTHSDLENQSTTYYWFDGLEWKFVHIAHSSK